MSLQIVKNKNLSLKKVLFAILKVTDENSKIRSRIRSRIQIHGSGSIPKCHGSHHWLELLSCSFYYYIKVSIAVPSLPRPPKGFRQRKTPPLCGTSRCSTTSGKHFFQHHPSMPCILLGLWFAIVGISQTFPWLMRCLKIRLFNAGNVQSVHLIMNFFPIFIILVPKTFTILATMSFVLSNSFKKNLYQNRYVGTYRLRGKNIFKNQMRD
jgi:hypothetical protein